MPKQWILDFVIKDGDYVGDPSNVEGSIWLVVAIDGSNQPFSTTQTGFSQNPVWNFAYRVLLNVSDLNRSYMYLTLCTFGNGGVGVVPLARSRVCLRSLPIGYPKLFSFPVMNVKNSSVPVLNIRVLATLSLLAPQLAPTIPPNSNIAVGDYPRNITTGYASFD